MTHFYEAASFNGTWHPRTQDSAPKVNKAGRMEKADGCQGPRVRSVVEVAPEHLGKSLDELAAIYGKDAG